MPVIWISIAFVAGIITADSLTWSLITWVWICLGTCLFGLIFLRIIRDKMPGFSSWMKGLMLGIAIAFGLGAVRYKVDLPNLEDPLALTNFTGLQDSTVLTGVVSDFPDRRDQVTNLRIKAEFIQKFLEEESIPVRGFLLAKIPVEEHVNYGDRV